MGLFTEQGSEFTDERDGQKYKTVKIGNQVWMAENLRFNAEGSWCILENGVEFCSEYGRLYDWNTAKAVCPKGWHLPSRDEWAELVDVAGSKMAGKKLKSTSGWYRNDISKDEFGFSALPGGCRSPGPRDSFGGVVYYGYWWTATEYDGGHAYCRYMIYDAEWVEESRLFEKGEGLSVRCVAD